MPLKTAPALHQADYPETDIQLATLWQAVKRGMPRLVMASAIVGALVFLALSLMAPRYAAESQLEFTARRSNPLPDGTPASASDSTARLDQAAINTHARALMSSDLLLKVATDLKLKTRPEFNAALGPQDAWGRIVRLFGIGVPVAGESEEERVLSVVRRQLEVAALKETRFISIRFSSSDGALAADFANRLADTYRASLVSQPIEETTRAVDALQPKVEALRKEVLAAEGEVERYRAASGQFRSGPQSTPLNDQRMAGLQDELLRAEAARNEAEARWRTAREMHRSGGAEVLPDVQKSALVQSLIQSRVRLERQIAEASASLLPGHPRMQQLNADVAGLRRQIASEVDKVVQSIEKDARSAALRVESVTRQIDALKATVVGQTGNEARLKELQSIALAKRTELERLQKQLEDNRTVVNIRQVPIEAQVIARAMPSAAPVFPRKTSSALLAATATMILGLALVITRTLIATPIAPSLPSPAPAPRALREPAFDGPERKETARAEPASLPPLRSRPISAASADRLSAGAHSLTALSPELTALAQRLLEPSESGMGMRTLVTTEGHAGQPLVEAQHLAGHLAAAGKLVLLIAWSPTGRLAPLPGPAIRRPGINDLIAGTAGFEEVIGRVPRSPVHHIQTGSPASALDDVLDPDRLNLTLDALDEAYDQIVIAADEQEATDLFEAVEGRFDAAALITTRPGPEMQDDGTAFFLGFETTGIDIVHARTAAAAASRAGQPRGTTRPETVSQPSA